MLTEAMIRDAKPDPERVQLLWDGRVKGLGVKVGKRGTRTFIIDYRTGGRQRRASIGRVGDLTLRDARKAAALELARIRAGEPGPLEQRREALEAPTVGEGVDRFLREYAPARIKLGRMSPRTLQTYTNQAKLYLRPALGKRRIEDVTAADVERAVGRLPNTTRNRVLALLSRLFNLFEKWGHRPQHTNPCRGVERARLEPRDRVLDSGELAALSAALDQLDERFPASVAAIRVAALTGLRISEVCAIQWQHVDFETGRVTLPETKTGRRVHHFPDAAIYVLRSRPRLHRSAYVFATDARGPLTYRTARTHFMTAAKLAGLPDARLHDLRRTVATGAAAAGVSAPILQQLLGHKTAQAANQYVRDLGASVADARRAIGAAVAAAMAGGK